MTEQTYRKDMQASREVMRRFNACYPELVERMPAGVRSEADATAWAEYYLTASVGPEEEGYWYELVQADSGVVDTLYEHVAFYIHDGLGPHWFCDGPPPEPNREQVMWCLWSLAGGPDLDARARPWQAAAWAEEVLPGARYGAIRSGGFSDGSEWDGEEKVAGGG